jgi:hypothetical protein
MPREIRVLFEELAAMPEAGRLQPVAAGQVIKGTSFFPGGWGLWDAPHNRRFPVGGTLVLGNTWGTQAYFEKVIDRGSEVRITPGGVEAKDPTWRNLIRILQLAKADPKDCFFTNAFPGLVVGNIVGSAGIRRADPTWGWFQEFFGRTLELMRPQLVLALGLEPMRFLGGEWARVRRFRGLANAIVTDPRGFTAVALLHPSAWPVNRTELGLTLEYEADLVRQAVMGRH